MPQIVTFGEIMGRLATPGFQRFQQAMPGSLEMTFAGAEASVAASIAYLGGEAAFVTALPSHAIADACVMDLRSLGVDTRHIVRTDAGRLGIYYLEKGVNQRAGNVIYDRAGSAVAITPLHAYDWDTIFANASWFLISGITPAISRNAAEVSLHAVRAAAERGVPVACDMNYRSKLWQWEPDLAPRELAARTMRELMPHVSLFLGGREDAAEMLGIRAASGATDEQFDIARQIVTVYPRMTHVALTMRESISATHNNVGGCLYVAADDRVFYAPLRGGGYEPYAVTDIVDRLGGGDAFTAGLLFALATRELAAPDRAIAFAVAAGCLAHSIEGDYNYTSREEIESLAAGAAPGRVRR
jgi:2-dehydro-3-deoxygluconokinase